MNTVREVPADRLEVRSDDSEGAQLTVLWELSRRPAVNQRELAKALGLSLGKTHYVLRALVDRGLVKIDNFRRSDNKLAYAYLLTPAGISRKAALTKAFLVRKEREFDALKRTIEALRNEVGVHRGSASDPRP